MEVPVFKNMKRAAVIIIAILLSGCSVSQNTQYEREERPHLYYKDIDVVVVNVERRSWFAHTRWYEVTVSVKSDEYQLSYEDTFIGQGIYGCLPQWEYNDGDIIQAELYSWVMDSTGEVVKRQINRIY